MVLPTPDSARDLIAAAEDRVPPRLAPATKRWLQRRQSDSSRANYARDLGITVPRSDCASAGLGWLVWCSARDVDPETATTEDLYDWLDDARALALASRRRMVAVISGWYTWLSRYDPHPILTHSPADGLDRRRLSGRGSASPSISLDPDQLAALYSVADVDGQRGVPPSRAGAILRLFVTTGIRCGELVSLTLDAWTPHGESGWLWINAADTKDTRSRWVEVPPQATSWLRAYLTERDLDETRPTHARVPLIATRAGHAMRAKDVRALIKRLARAGAPEIRSVSSRVHPHTLRHTFATSALSAGVPLQVVQDAMGHASPMTTRLYDHADNHGQSPALVADTLVPLHTTRARPVLSRA